MRVANSWLKRQVALSLTMLLMVPFGAAATPRAPQTAENVGQTENQVQNNAQNPGKPATAAGQQISPSTDSTPAPAQSGDEKPQAPSPQAESASQQNANPAPVGTAVAPYIKPNGAPASRPAGAAIAPAKQRRVRSWAIRVGLLAGAAIAIGAVTAASMGSPSRPN